MLCPDTAGFMKEAHGLYRSNGLYEIEAYEGSEIPKEFQQHWIFMERDLCQKQDRRCQRLRQAPRSPRATRLAKRLAYALGLIEL